MKLNNNDRNIVEMYQKMGIGYLQDIKNIVTPEFLYF